MSNSRQRSDIIANVGARDFIFSQFDTKIKVRNLQYFMTVWKVFFLLTSFLFHPGDVMAARTRSSLVGEHCLEFIEPTVVGSQICKWCIRCFYSSGVFKMTRHWKIYKNIKSFIKLNTYSMYNSTQMMSIQYGICSTFKNTIK